MDISGEGFPFQLVNILQIIADSHFIAFDLEFSGIASRREGIRDRGKLTLQQYYEDVKEAARKYQILQVGLTVVQEDLEKGSYLLRPYNFYINPIPSSEKLRLERIWSFQSGAVDFLLKNHFRFDLPYTNGVSYLSRQEQRAIQESWKARDEDRSGPVDLRIKKEDVPLINYVREAIQKWEKQPPHHRNEVLYIPNAIRGERLPKSVPRSLNRYQMWLVHQLVRNEYPRLKTTGKDNVIQVTVSDGEYEIHAKDLQARYREHEISKAVEFRWLIEAMSGGDITKIPREYFLSAVSSSRKPDCDQNEALTSFVEDLQAKLHKRRRILVGHNCFTDLVYLYECFIGDAPEKVEHFSKTIHAMFPAVVDTKFMSSFDRGRRGTSLKEVVESLSSGISPTIEVPVESDSYSANESYHEAGYDSFLTAQVAIKLSARLEKGSKYPSLNNPSLFGFVADEDGQTEAYETATNSESIISSLTSMFTGMVLSPINTIGSFFRSDAGASDEHSAEIPESRSNLTSRDNALTSISTDRKATTLLGSPVEDRVNEGGEMEVPKAEDEISMSETTDKALEETRISTMVGKGELMPRWDGGRGFWNYFGNKLQVNGCEEGVCLLS